MSEPVGFFITWTTYGTWLPGDRRGWVASDEPGVRAADAAREDAARRRMSARPVVLDSRQRRVVETTIRRHCEMRSWELHAVNVRTNHVHLVLSADAMPETVMGQLKAWCARRLNEAQASDGSVTRKTHWWTEHGSTQWINDQDGLHNAIEYVLEGQ